MIINIKVSIKKLLEQNYQINPEITEQLFNEGILKEHICKKFLIKDEYKRKAQPKEKQRVRNMLAEKYCISVSSVEKTLFKNT